MHGETVKLGIYWFMKKEICIHDSWSVCKKFYVVHMVRFIQLTLLCTETSLLLNHHSMNINFSNLFLSFGATAPSGQGLLIHEVSRSHTTTHHSR